MSPEGEKVQRPTREKPAYYFPIYVGYEQRGTVLPGMLPPPPLDEVQRALTDALAEQGYRVATNRFPPSLALVFRWGYIAPLPPWMSIGSGGHAMLPEG